MSGVRSFPLLLSVLLCLDVAGGAGPSSATLGVTDLRCEYLVDPLGIDVREPRFSWKLVDSEHTRGQRQTAWQVVVTGLPMTDGADPRELWDSGKVESGQSVLNAYAGEALVSNQDARWKVRVWDKDGAITGWSEPARFSMGLLDPADWRGEWIRHPDSDELKHIWFRRNLPLEAPPKQAFLHLASLGYHELYVNGRRVDDRVLAPAVTNLEKRILYVTYDIAPHLRAGDNVIAVWMGAGWARADGSYGKGVWQQPSAFKCQLDMSNGTGIHSDTAWKCAFSHMTYRGPWKGGGKGQYGGEILDARCKLDDWNAVGFDDSGWVGAVTHQKEAVLSAHMLEPDRKVESFKPVSLDRNDDGSWTYDLGRNYTGWLELDLRGGREGDVVRFTTGNLKGERVVYNQESHYIHDAGGEGTFCHRFNYHAGRWVTVHGLREEPRLGDVTAHVITNDRRRAGSFESSNELFNEIFEVDLRTYLANTVNGVTMDCPHRERYGYGEIALACSWGCAIPHYDSAAYYRKVARDWFDVQGEDGFVNTIAPQVYKGAGGTLWSSAPVTLSWEFHKAYGDLRQLGESWPSMKKWADFLGRSVSEDGVLVPYTGASRFLGDWATPHGSEYGDTPPAQLFNNGVYAYCLQIVVESAKALGKDEEAALYQKRLEDLRVNVHRHFYDPEAKRYLDGRQLAMAFPLYVGITPPDERQAVMDGFVAEISERKPYLDTGSSGLPILLKFVVEDSGRADLLFQCLNRTEKPGYGHFLAEGSTTWPEYWNMYDHKSQIHTCYTGISGYLTKAIGGIRPDPAHPGMQRFLVQPALVGDLSHAKSVSGSLYGRMLSQWRRDGENATFEIEVPVNTTATVHLPARRPGDLTEGGKPIGEAAGVTHVGEENGCQVLRVESGQYRFTSKSVPAAAAP